MVYFGELHKQGRGSNETRTNLDQMDVDACRLPNTLRRRRSGRGASKRRSCTMTLLFVVWMSMNSITLFLEGVQCNSQTDNYYTLLELTPQASKSEIKKAFRRLSKKYHPDKNKGDE